MRLKHTVRRILPTVVAAALLIPPSFADIDETVPDPAPHRVQTLSAAHFDLPKYLPVLEWVFGTNRKNESKTRPYFRRNLFRRVAGDQVFLLTSWWPEEFGKVRFALPITLAAVAAARTGSDPGAWDRRTARFVHAWATGGFHDAGEFLSKIGESRNALLLLGSTYLISRATGSERVERATSLSAEALLNSALYVGVLKKVLRRTRPFNGGTGEFFVSDPLPGQSNGSYPSGHATGVFAVAAVFTCEFRDSRWVPWVAYGTAALVALSRVSLGRHFPTDILTGAILGDSVGRMVSHRSASHAEGLDPMWTDPGELQASRQPD